MQKRIPARTDVSVKETFFRCGERILSAILDLFGAVKVRKKDNFSHHAKGTVMW